MKKAVLDGLIFAGASALALNVSATVWYEPAPGEDGRSWMRATGWSNKTLPTLDSEAVSVNNAALTPGDPLVIPASSAACANSLVIGSMADRTIGLKMESGASLRTKLSFALGEKQDASAGHGVFTMNGGTWYVCSDGWGDYVGKYGTGVVTNHAGRYVMDVSGRYLRIGSYSGAHGKWVQYGGSMDYGDDPNPANKSQVVVGYAGEGVVEIYGGSVSNRLFVGAGDQDNGKGRGRVLVDGGEVSVPELLLGSGAGSRGSLVVSNGLVSASERFVVGYEGYGNLLIHGGKVTSREQPFIIGHSNGATGEVSFVDGQFEATHYYVGRSGYGVLNLNGGHLPNDRNVILGERAYQGMGGVLNVNSAPFAKDGLFNVIYAGQAGSGRVNANADFKARYLKVGSSGADCGGVVSISNDVIVSVTARCDVGGTFSDSGVFMPGKGEVALHGGTLSVTGLGGEASLLVGRSADSWGVIRGWGSVRGSTWGANNLYLAFGRGRIIGDGEGAARVLDLTSVVNVKPADFLIDSPTNTTGWYAMNGGAVYFPRTWFSGKSTYNLGDDKTYAGQPRLVNSLKFTVDGLASSSCHMRGGVVAADRADVHTAGLPRNRRIIGCWRLGVTASLQESAASSTPVAFKTMSITFRYDQTKVRRDDSLELYRYAGGEWTKLASAEVGDPETDPHLITTSTFASDDTVTDGYNAGVFALVRDTSGTLIMIK